MIEELEMQSVYTDSACMGENGLHPMSSQHHSWLNALKGKRTTMI